MNMTKVRRVDADIRIEWGMRRRGEEGQRLCVNDSSKDVRVGGGERFSDNRSRQQTVIVLDGVILELNFLLGWIERLERE